MDKKDAKAWLYLLPAILFLGVFMVYPLIDVLIYSFEEGYNSASQTSFGVGSYNYSYVLHAKESYEDGQCHLQLIRNAGHGFDEKQTESMIASIKQFLNNIMQDILRPIRETRNEWKSKIKEVIQILKNGTEKANKIAQVTLNEVKQAMGIDFFDNDNFTNEMINKY